MAADVEPSSFGDQTAPPVADADSETSTLDAVADRWPIDARSASVALRRHVAMTLPGLVLLAIASPVCLAVGMITLEQPWAAWDVNEVAPTVAYLLILAAVVIPFEFARQIHRRRRVIRIGRRMLEKGMSICPRRGSDPFDPGTCCRSAPVGWSPLDLHGFWHEGTVQRVKLDVRLIRRAGNLGLPSGSRHDRLRDVDFATAWRRPRGPHGTSLARPRANLAAKAGRSIGRWWTMLSPLGFVLLAIITLPPALTIGGGLSTMSWIFIGIILVGGLGGLIIFLRRVGDQSESGLRTVPRCNACRYRLHPPFPDQCPECGAGIRTAQDLTFVPYRAG